MFINKTSFIIKFTNYKCIIIYFNLIYYVYTLVRNYLLLYLTYFDLNFHKNQANIRKGVKSKNYLLFIAYFLIVFFSKYISSI